uniref:RNA-dependent RNA polymerase n=1 Tax=Davis virus TaxID=2707210 RepID=A0A6H0DIK5_9VIRU|nr:MAG: RNA-dependent RNA polymerase [Davis virus]
MSNDVAQDVCKSVRALGLSAPRTRRIVDGVIRDLANNGPEWVANRLKGLQAYYAGTDDFPGWVRRRTRHDGLLKPTGWLGSLVGSKTKPDTIITVLSTVRGAMVFDKPTHKQLVKWSSSVTEPPLPKQFRVPSIRGLQSLEHDLVRRVKKLKTFGPDDIHGSRYPKGVSDGVIRRGRGLDMSGLYHAWKDSILFAPTLAWSFQDQSGVRIPGMSQAKSRPILNRLRKEAPDAKRKVPSKKRSGRASVRVDEYPVGHISFLQEPFGKLRTVANPNRFVQWQLTPLGETLSDWINHQPGIYNLCQEEGIQWIQDQLDQGIRLTSADLSSASDTLDFRPITHALQEAGHEMRKHLEYFEQISEMPWYITSDEARSFMGRDTVRWKQGQPLGLRPSFPVLSITNWLAARQAVIQVDGKEAHPDNPPFCIVGDDIVIHTRYGRAYQEQIAALGGVANVDKACESETQAEFCSRLIRKGKPPLRLKAKYLENNSPQNVLTYQGLVPSISSPHWVKRSAQRVGRYAIVEAGLIPDYHPDQPRPLRQKVLMNAVLSLQQGKATTVEKSLHAMWLAASQDAPHGVLPQPRKDRETQCSLLDASFRERQRKFREWNPNFKLEDLPLKLGMRTRYYPNIWNSLMDEALKAIERDPRLKAQVPEVRWIEDTHPESLREVELGSARMQSVDTVRSRFDHKTMTYVPDVSPENALSHLDRKIQSLEKDLVLTEGSETAMIRRISPDVDELLEVKENGVESTFFGKTSQSPTVTIPFEEIISPPKVSRPNKPLRSLAVLNSLCESLHIPKKRSNETHEDFQARVQAEMSPPSPKEEARRRISHSVPKSSRDLDLEL